MTQTKDIAGHYASVTMTERGHEPGYVEGSAKKCRSSYYALAFLIPFFAMALNSICAGQIVCYDTIIALLAGSTGLTLYSTIKWFRHRKCS